jgi:Kef-type K+ transport system membrane component KefB
VALAALTPSTGFILDAIDTFDVSERERFWIKSKAIATEILALFVLFLTLQLVTLSVLLISCLTLLAMIMLLPIVLRAFAAFIVPHAPRSEFAFLLMMAVVCAFVTRELGVYYLVGAFVVGMAAQRFRRRLPAMASEQMVHALELFASFFVPFYFFNAGLHLRREDLGIGALLVGGALLLTMLPLRIGVVLVHRAIALGEHPKRGIRVAASMLPTLVFTLVIAEILRDRFGISPALFGGLVVYAIGNTLIPGIALRIPTTEITTPHATPLPDFVVDAERADSRRDSGRA